MHTALQGTPVVLSDVDQDWRKYAACKGNTNATELFFAHQCTHNCTKVNAKKCEDDPTVQEARNVCLSCPVLDRCRWWAVVTNLTHGMAGGMTFAQRLVVRKRLRKDPIGKALIEGRVELEM